MVRVDGSVHPLVLAAGGVDSICPSCPTVIVVDVTSPHAAFVVTTTVICVGSRHAGAKRSASVPAEQAIRSGDDRVTGDGSVAWISGVETKWR